MTADGHVYGLGDAHSDGSPSPANAPYAAISVRPAGGYVVTEANDAAAYLYPGNIPELGGGPGTALAATLVGAAATPSGNGTWQTGADGGVVTTGQTTSTYAPFYGSVPGQNEQLKAPVTAIAANPDGRGYWLLDAERDGVRLRRRRVLRVRERLESSASEARHFRSQLAWIVTAPSGAVTLIGSPQLSNCVVVPFCTTSTGNGVPLERR